MMLCPADIKEKAKSYDLAFLAGAQGLENLLNPLYKRFLMLFDYFLTTKFLFKSVEASSKALFLKSVYISIVVES